MLAFLLRAYLHTAYGVHRLICVHNSLHLKNYTPCIDWIEDSRRWERRSRPHHFHSPYVGNIYWANSWHNRKFVFNVFGWKSSFLLHIASSHLYTEEICYAPKGIFHKKIQNTTIVADEKTNPSTIYKNPFLLPEKASTSYQIPICRHFVAGEKGKNVMRNIFPALFRPSETHTFPYNA